MSGISFVVDERGEKTAAVIDLQQHGKLWEDFSDLLVSTARAREPRESLQEVKRKLKSKARRDG